MKLGIGWEKPGFTQLRVFTVILVSFTSLNVCIGERTSLSLKIGRCFEGYQWLYTFPKIVAHTKFLAAIAVLNFPVI